MPCACMLFAVAQKLSLPAVMHNAANFSACQETNLQFERLKCKQLSLNTMHPAWNLDSYMLWCQPAV